MAYGQVNVDKTVNSDGTITGGLYGFKNRIINGAMMIDQRNSGASVTPSSDNQYYVDRFQAQASAIRSNTSLQQVNVPAPLAGFSKAFKFIANSSSSVGSADYFSIGQMIEGFNWADFNWGTANAKSVTFSFWVYGSIAGTFGGVMKAGDQSRSYPFTYSINSTNTWEQKTITIPGDTSGTWPADNGRTAWVQLSLACGSTYTGTPLAWNSSVNVGATGQSNAYLTTSGATFYTTGWQLEKGSTATTFDYRPYGTELQLCQRYLPVWSSDLTADRGNLLGQAFSTTQSLVTLIFPVTARTAPTGLTSTGTFNAYNAILGGSSASLTFNNASAGGAAFVAAVGSGLVAGNASLFQAQGSGSKIIFTGCEL